MTTSVNTNTAASGATNVPIATEIIASDAFQRMKLAVGAVGVDSGDVSSSNPLPVVQTGTPALPTGAATEATLSTLNGKIPATVNGSQPCTLRNSSGAAIASLALATTLEGLLTSIGATDFFFSTANATTAQLAASATFTGTVESIVSAQAWSVILTSDQPGTLTLTEYIDAGGTRISSNKVITVSAGVPFSRAFTANGNYFRLAFENTGGSATTTLNINVAFGVLPAVTSLGNAPVAINEVNGTALSLGQATMAASLPVVIASNQSAVPVSGTVTTTPPTNASTNVAQINGATPDMGAGASSANTLRVVLATNASVNINQISGGAPDMNTGAASANTLRVALANNSSTNVNQINGVAPLMGNGVTGTGSLRVTIASNNTQNTNPWLMAGAAAHSTASVDNPVRIGGRVITTLDTTLVQGDASDIAVTTGQQLVVKGFASSENDWQFACAAGGIVNTTTGVTVKAAGAASIRNFMTSLTLSADALGAATEVIVYDGTTATVLWRTKIQTAGLASQTFNFPTPLRGSAATLMGVATVTASVTGGLIFSCSGYQSF